MASYIEWRRRSRRAGALAGQLGEGMAAIAANDIRNLRLAVMAGEALVVVRMSRQHRMRPDPGFLAHRVNLQKHLFAPAMLAAGAVSGMMVRQDQGAVEVFGFDTGEGGLEVGELGIADRAVGNDARILQRVAIEREDADKRRLEAKKDTRLDLGGARQTARFGRYLKVASTEIFQECRQCRGAPAWRNHAVVVAGQCYDRRRVIAIGLVKLVVVIFRLAKAVDDIAEVEEEVRLPLIGVGEIVHH